ncbi:MAG: C1 family peptidase [Actinomycetota bacterium]
MSTNLSETDLELMRKEFQASPKNRVAQNAVSQTSLDGIALDREVVVGTDRTVSNLLDDWTVTNQKKSGRCWLFAGLNLVRVGAAQTMNLKEFEFSQNHLMFWDKLERANFFLEAIIETSDRDLDDRTVAFLLTEVAGDGGQWNMFVALVAKHGLVPKTVMPETESSSATARMNEILQSVLRQGALELRGCPAEEQSERKKQIVESVHRILCIHLGTPPERFAWQWTDKDRVFHRDAEMTPKEFATKYVGVALEDYVCLVDDCRPTSPKGRTFTVDYLGNVVGGPPVVYLNVDMALMKKAAMDSIVAGVPVWFGCDVAKMYSKDLGLWDARLYDLESVYDVSFSLDKAERLAVHDAMMTHAMLFTGVDVVDGSPRKWRVENSWGDEKGDKGFWTMNDNWFDEHVFEIAARRDQLPPELMTALEAEPIVLPAWDPMGSLAR